MEKLEIKVRKTMKEKYNIEIPEDCWMFPMKQAKDYVEFIEGFSQFGCSVNFDNIYIVVAGNNSWGFVDLEHGVYIEPMCYDVSLKESYIIMNGVTPKCDNGRKSYFHHCAYDVKKGKLSIDLKITTDISTQGAKFSEELFEDDGDLTVQAHDSGYQTISVNDKMGLLSEDTLTRYIEPQYDALMLAWGDVEELCNQITKQNQIYCVVKNNGKFGVVDLSNKIILPLDFDSFDELEAYCKEQISQVGV